MICLKNAVDVDSIELMDRAFHYGDGCFSTARLFHDHFELENLHLARLKISAERLLLDIDLDLLQKSLDVLRSRVGELNGTLKIIISRGSGQRGYSLPDQKADLYCLFFPQNLFSHRMDIINSGSLNTAIGLQMPNLVGIKSLNRLEQVILKREADQHQWSEAIVTDVQGSVVEGVSSNCFFKINKQWITPELRYNGVHGVMRAHILCKMKAHDIECEQRYVEMDEIEKIESLFFCNALHPMKAVHQFNQTFLDVQPCSELFKSLQLNQMRDYV